MKSLVIELKHNRAQQLVITLASSSLVVLVGAVMIATLS